MLLKSPPLHVGSSAPSFSGRSAVAIKLPQVSRCVRTAAQKLEEPSTNSIQKKLGQISGLGDALGPIGITLGGEIKKEKISSTIENDSGLALGPISLSFGREFNDGQPSTSSSAADSEGTQYAQPESIHSMSTEEWRAQFEKDGMVDLWIEEEFNSGSRLVGGRAVHKGGVYGFRTGEGISSGEVTSHKVKIFNHHYDQVVEVEVPEDRYVMWEAEDQGLQLPYACRMGCCTACAVRIKEGEMYQPEALGISQELKDQGYGLMCVGFPLTDLVLETVSEDEVYDLQFGKFFASQALNPELPSIERDDYALSMANMDE